MPGSVDWNTLERCCKQLSASLPTNGGTHYRVVGEVAVDQHVAAIKQKFSLWSEELAQVYRFLTQVRLDLDGKPVTLGKDSGETAHWLAVLVTERATKMWRSCKQTAKRSRTRPEYLYATTAAALFYKSMIEKDDLPRPNNLAALMRLERVAAERALAARSNISSLYANVPSQRMDATTTNIAAQGVETIQVTEKGIEFPGMEAPVFKSGTADQMDQSIHQLYPFVAGAQTNRFQSR